MSPPGDPKTTSARENRERCKSMWYPLADTLSASSGALLVARAAADEADNHPANYSSGFDENGNYYTTMVGSHYDDTYKYERAFGYTALIAFGASAIYGYVVQAECNAGRHEYVESVAQQARREAREARLKAQFPSSVYGFGFTWQAAQAAQLCQSNGGLWSFESGAGTCRPALEAPANPDVRLEFELGTPSAIVVTYHPRLGGANQNYSQVYSSMLASYGPPQVAPAAPSPACVTSLEQCLATGETPRGAEWHWAAGSISFSPVWKNDHVLLELRYAREEPQTR